MHRYSTRRQVCECATIGYDHFPNSPSSQPELCRYSDACSATSIFSSIGCNHFPKSPSSQPEFCRYSDACSATSIFSSRVKCFAHLSRNLFGTHSDSRTAFHVRLLRNERKGMALRVCHGYASVRYLLSARARKRLDEAR